MDGTLRSLTRKLCRPGRGVLALDTGAARLDARLRAAGVAPTAAAARAFRSAVVLAPQLGRYASGVVLRPDDLGLPIAGRPAPQVLLRAGVLPGVRVDTGHEPGVVGTARVTSGLDGLAERLARFRAAGARFGVWSVCTTPHPADLASLTVNSQAAARYARTSQNHGLVPVVRVGSRMSGDDPGARGAALAAALLSLCGHMEDLEVDLAAVVVDVVCVLDAAPEPVWATPLAVLPDHLGAVALSVSGAPGPGGDAVVAGALDALVGTAPWPVTFTVGREVTEPVMRAWDGRPVPAEAVGQALARGLERVAARLPGRRPSLAALPAVAAHG